MGSVVRISPFTPSISGCRHVILVKAGRYFRSSDGKIVQRFMCNKCSKTCSEATQDPYRHHRKRQLNKLIYRTPVSGVSQRRCALILELNRKTVVRKFQLFGMAALECLKLRNSEFPKSRVIEFDDLETFEHSKCKPVTVCLAVEYKTRRVLDFEIARMPAKGLLAAISRKKYGFRTDERPKAYEALFQRLNHFVENVSVIKSDKNPHYPYYVKKYFPEAHHITYKGRKPASTGQGELKKVEYDPIFSLNHTFAKLRADINRLFRKTWCTTKKPDCLRKHIAMMVVFHNGHLKQK